MEFFGGGLFKDKYKIELIKNGDYRIYERHEWGEECCDTGSTLYKVIDRIHEREYKRAEVDSYLVWGGE